MNEMTRIDAVRGMDVHARIRSAAGGFNEGEQAPPSRPRGVTAKEIPELRPPRFERKRATASGRIPTARECLPHRPPVRPRFSPARGRRRDPSRPQLTGRITTRMSAAPGLGQTRINFNYGNHGTTSADFLDKSGRQHFSEGPHEDSRKRRLTVNPCCTDLQFQPIKADFEDQHGNKRTAYWDIGIELLGSILLFGEIKADRSFFSTEDMDAVVRMSAATLDEEGIAFVRLHGTDFDDISAGTIKSVFDRRRTSFDKEADVVPLTDAIDASGGSIELASALGILEGYEAEAEAKLCAMMCARHISIDLDLPLTNRTLIRRAPSPKGHGALRRFLTRFAEAA